MSCSIKLYKLNEFIRKDETGEIDLKKSKHIIHDLATAAAFNIESHILLDLRETTLNDISFNTLMDIAIEFARYRSVFRNKIANIVPNDRERLFVAKQFKSALNIQGFEFDYFTKIEDAFEWFSEVTELKN